MDACTQRVEEIEAETRRIKAIANSDIVESTVPQKKTPTQYYHIYIFPSSLLNSLNLPMPLFTSLIINRSV